MSVPQIVIDTNVLVSALRSNRGASYRLLSVVDSHQYEINVSVPLVLEYEDVLSRSQVGLSSEEVRGVVDYLCSVANRRKVFFLWRPFLTDPKDDLILELAVAAGCDAIVTFNHRHFVGVDRFQIRAMSPRDFLQELGL